MFSEKNNNQQTINTMEKSIKQNVNNNNSFKIGDFVTYKSFDEWGLPAGIERGEIVDIDGEYASIVLGGIDLNNIYHFEPNYMQPIRIRPIKPTDVVIKRKISTLSSIDNTKWGNGVKF